jgi:hypothetical protein
MRLSPAIVALALCACRSPSSPKDMSQDLSAAGPDLAASGMAAGGASVLQMHNHATRDGVFVEPSFTVSAVAKLHMDSGFDGSYAQAGSTGNVYAQALFVDRGGMGDIVIVATEDNYVLAFDATTGKLAWHADPKLIGTAAPSSAFNCGNINPNGITGTPVIDLSTHAIFFVANTVAGGMTRHLIWSLSIDDGSARPGWPIDVTAIVPDFASRNQGQRGALTIVGNKVYVPFGGRYGDCTPYRGYVIGVPLTNPTAGASVVFQTKATLSSGGGAGAGIWGPPGVASDGTSLYFVTGNTMTEFPSGWAMSYSEGVFRLPPSLAFATSDTTSYFAPPDWNALDHSDTDACGSGVMLVDLPGAAKPHLAIVLGKDQKLYMLDRGNLGGAGVSPLFSGTVAGSEIINAPSVYTTTQGTWVTFKAPCPGGGAPTVNAVQLTTAPGMGPAWCAKPQGGGSPVASTTGGGANSVVWWVSTEGENITPDYKLYGFDGNTGATLVSTAAMKSVKRFVSPIVAKGHVYVAADGRLYSFVTP